MLPTPSLLPLLLLLGSSLAAGPSPTPPGRALLELREIQLQQYQSRDRAAFSSYLAADLQVHFDQPLYVKYYKYAPSTSRRHRTGHSSRDWRVASLR